MEIVHTAEILAVILVLRFDHERDEVGWDDCFCLEEAVVAEDVDVLGEVVD